MAERRRTPLVFTVLTVVLILLPVVGVAWWLARPAAPQPDGKLPEEFDVVCMGRVDVPGMVVPLEPAAAGRVVEVSPEGAEGRMVKAGQFILRIEDAAQMSRKKGAEASVAFAESSLQQALLDAERFPQQLEARNNLVAATGARVATARKTLEQRKLQSNVTPIGKAEMEAMESQISEMELLESAEKAQFADLKKLRPQLAVDAAQARKRAAEAELELADRAVQECVLHAPADGRILRMQAAVGGQLVPGSMSPAVVFAPSAGGLIVRAEIDQEFLGRVREGQAADIQDENRIDAKVYAGKVSRLSRWVAQKRSMILDPGELNDVRTVECVVAFDAPPDDLFIGQRMRVRIRWK